MGKLIAIRHGQSTWNAENRFTGWVDVDLSAKGVREAQKSGENINRQNLWLYRRRCRGIRKEIRKHFS